MFCENCGKASTINDTFCTGCGALLKKPLSPRKKNKTWLILLIAGSSVVAGIIILWIFIILAAAIIGADGLSNTAGETIIHSSGTAETERNSASPSDAPDASKQSIEESSPDASTDSTMQSASYDFEHSTLMMSKAEVAAAEGFSEEDYVDQGSGSGYFSKVSKSFYIPCDKTFIFKDDKFICGSYDYIFGPDTDLIDQYFMLADKYEQLYGSSLAGGFLSYSDDSIYYFDEISDELMMKELLNNNGACNMIWEDGFKQYLLELAQYSSDTGQDELYLSFSIYFISSDTEV